MRYLKLYEQFNREYSINWVAPEKEVILSEIHELLNNLSFFFLEENFDKAYKKLPSVFHHILTKYLKKETRDINEIRQLFVGKNQDDFDIDMKTFKSKPSEEMQKEIFNFIRSGKLMDWPEELVKKTGNMGDLTQVFGPGSGRGGIKAKIKFKSGVEGIEDLKNRLDTDLKPIAADMGRYLITYDELVKEKTITKPAPFVINLKNLDGDPYHLIGGHKRSTIALQLGIPVKVWFLQF